MPLNVPLCVALLLGVELALADILCVTLGETVLDEDWVKVGVKVELAVSLCVPLGDWVLEGVVVALGVELKLPVML